MVRKIKIPFIDANIQEVTIIKWLCKEGDSVTKKQPIAEMTTEKASFEFESPYSGTLLKILAPERSILPIGYIIAIIGKANETIPDLSEYNRKIIEKYRAKTATFSDKQE